jgi:hypothetical protein
MPLPFETVRERLLRAGFAPRHVGRYLTELREHLADLTRRERASGLDEKAAADRARSILGTDAQLAQAMIDKGAPRSLAARAPWAVFALSPVLLLVAVLAVNALSMMNVLQPVRGLSASQMPKGYFALIEVMSFVVTYLAGALLAAGCIVIALRQRLATHWVWIGVGLISVLNGLFGFHMNAMAPGGGLPGGTTYSVANIIFLDGHPNLAATLGVAFLHAAILFLVAAATYRALQTPIAAPSA